MKKTRFLSALMAVIVMFGAAGCGSSDNSGGSTGPSPRLKSDAGASNGADVRADDAGEAAPEAETAEDFAGKTADGEFTADAAEGDMKTADIAMDGLTAAAEGDAAKGADAEPSGETNGDAAVQLPEAGQLTAGEWNDNLNWGFFTNLVNSQAIGFPSFGIDPRFRTAVTVTTADGAAVPNAKVRLLDADGKVIWNAVADKNGTAYLFGQNGVKVEVVSGGATSTFEVKALTSDEQSGEMSGSREVSAVIEDAGKLYKETEIMFIVDTTGSMGDEMTFLQSEFSAITQAVGTDNIKYAVNFYRDEGDDYVVKTNPFTSNVSDLQALLNKEWADGGGDFPEAVAEALDESIVKAEWSEESVKIAFLIFDAPPHDGKEEMLLQAAKAAAEKGIRLVPVVSSNADRSTELFGRAISIVTGGTYVFLTDDSGIGGSHLEPIIGSYEVEKLYDLIIRVINNYKQ